jgi:hypothetical protein
MRLIPPEDFPPAGMRVIEHYDRHAVLFQPNEQGFEITVWHRENLCDSSTTLGDWYCDPEAGLFLSLDGAHVLSNTLEETLKSHVPLVDLDCPKIVGCTCGWRTPARCADSESAYVKHYTLAASENAGKHYAIAEAKGKST